MRIIDWSSDVCSSDLRQPMVATSDISSMVGRPMLVVDAEYDLPPADRCHDEGGENAGRGQRVAGPKRYSKVVGDLAGFQESSEERSVGKEWGSTLRYWWAE